MIAGGRERREGGVGGLGVGMVVCEACVVALVKMPRWKDRHGGEGKMYHHHWHPQVQQQVKACHLQQQGEGNRSVAHTHTHTHREREEEAEMKRQEHTEQTNTAAVSPTNTAVSHTAVKTQQ